MSSRVEVSPEHTGTLSLPLYLLTTKAFASFWPGITPLYWPRCKRVAGEHNGYIYLWAREGWAAIFAARRLRWCLAGAVGVRSINARFVPEVLTTVWNTSLVMYY